MCAKGIHCQVSVDTLNWHSVDISIDTQPTSPSILDRRLINISIDTQLTLNQQSNLMFGQLIWIAWRGNQLRGQLNVDRVSTEVLMEYALSVDQRLIVGIEQHSTTDAFSTLDL